MTDYERWQQKAREAISAADQYLAERERQRLRNALLSDCSLSEVEVAEQLGLVSVAQVRRLRNLTGIQREES